MTEFSACSHQPVSSDLPAKASQPSKPSADAVHIANTVYGVNWDSPLILETKTHDGKLIMPATWRDDDDSEAEDDY